MTEAIVDKRKIFSIGGSYAITIPQEFVKVNGLDVDGEIALVGNTNELRLIPIKNERVNTE